MEDLSPNMILSGTHMQIKNLLETYILETQKIKTNPDFALN